MANGLLGMFQPQPDQFQTLLGEYYDPKTSRMKWLGGSLQGLGAGLASGRPGAWAQGLAMGGGEALEDYQKQALLGYQMAQQQERQDYERGRDATADERWEKQFGIQQRGQLQNDWRFSQETDEAERQAGLRAGQQNAVEGFAQDFTSQGGDLFSPQMQMGLRQQGISGVDPADTQRYDRMQPYIAAQDYGGAFQQMTAQPAGNEPFTLGEGQIRYDGSGRPIAAGPGKPPTTPSSVQEYEYYVGQLQAQGVPQDQWPTFQQFELESKKAGAPKTSIEMEGDSYGKERGKGFATQMTEIEAAEAAAYDTLNSAAVMQQMMQDPNFYSGWGGGMALQAKQFLATIGGNPDAAASMEGFTAESKRLALATMGGSLGSGFSNADRDFVEYQVANLAFSPEGNASLLEINRRLAERKIQIAQMARQYEIDNGRIDARFKQELSQWARANPVFPEAASMDTQRQRPQIEDPLGIRRGGG
jgi:hypothetical protein